METMQWDELRFASGGSALETKKRTWNVKTACYTISWSLRQKVCSMFSRSGWSVVRRASLATGGTSKKRPSPRLHKFPTRSNKVSPRTFQTALVFYHNWYNYYFITSDFLIFSLPPIYAPGLTNGLLPSGFSTISHFPQACYISRPSLCEHVMKPASATKSWHIKITRR
jgi:hypothetical protein